MAILTSSHRPCFAAVTLYNRTPHDQIPFPCPSRSRLPAVAQSLVLQQASSDLFVNYLTTCSRLGYSAFQSPSSEWSKSVFRQPPRRLSVLQLPRFEESEELLSTEHALVLQRLPNSVAPSTPRHAPNFRTFCTTVGCFLNTNLDSALPLLPRRTLQFHPAIAISGQVY
jgi:hypothetical protein